MQTVNPLYKAKNIEPRRRARMLAGILFTAVLVYGGCKTVQQNPADELETAQAFIRHCNSNHFDEASTLLEATSENQRLLKAEQERYSGKTSAAMEKARAADIIVREIQTISETERIFLYATSDEQGLEKKLRLVRSGDRWLVRLLP